MSCSYCAPALEACTTVFPVLSPCRCDSPGGIEEIGPDGNTGPKGETPTFSVGVVTSGGALITVRSTGYATRAVDWRLPAVPEGEAYDWSAVNTFAQSSIFELGLVTTGGTSTFGGYGFTVSPNATFSGDLHVAGNSEIEGDVDVTTNLNEDNDLSVIGTSTFDNIEFRGSNDIRDTEWSLSNSSGYVGGMLNLASCLDMERQPNVRSGVFTQGVGTNLVPVAPVDTGVICDPIVINVPVSACLPQVTPIVDIIIRVSYTLNSALFFNYFTATLWQGSVGGTLLDFYTLGDPALFNDEIGCLVLKARATLAVGNNNFYIEVENPDAVGSFEPTYVRYEYKN